MDVRSRRLAFALACLTLATCSENERRPIPDEEPEVASVGSSRSAPVSGAEFPIVEVVGEQILVDGEPAGDTRAATERLAKLDELFTRMKGLREAYKSANPDKPFPGVAGLRVGADTKLVAVKSAFQTMAYAGYPWISIQTIGTLAPIYSVTAQIPGPPRPMGEVDPRPPPKLLRIHADDAKITLTWQQGSVVIAEEKAQSANLAAKVCSTWKEHGTHQDASDPVPDQVVLSASNRESFGEVTPILDAVNACTRDYRDASGAVSKRPAFHVVFSIR